jgi:peptidoglycan/xylan/chitin deacetylase (PgdA/CDA1 family)
MHQFISTKNTTKKAIQLSLIMGFLMFGLYAYDQNSIFINNFQGHYVRSSIEGLKYTFRENKALLASALTSLPESTIAISSHEFDHAQSLPVLVYHGVVDTPDRFSLTPEKFQEQMIALKKSGYKTVTIEQVNDFINNHIELPDKSFLLTFDDGRKDSFYGADPILRAMDFNAVMFIATSMSIDENKVDHPYYLLNSELKRMIKTGRWEIQSHAVQDGGGYVTLNQNGDKGNFLSNRQWIEGEHRLENPDEYKQRVKLELTKSKNDIQNYLGNNVIAISYPFGDFGQQSKNNPTSFSEQVVNSNIKEQYKLAFQQIWPEDNGFSQNYPNDNFTSLKRIEPSPSWAGDELIYWLTIGRTKNLSYTDNFEINNGWKSSWGKMSIENNVLKSFSSVASTGSFAFLDGTYPWIDYMFNADLAWKKGNNVFLVARYKDTDNYLTCTFSDDYIRIDRVKNGLSEHLAEVKNNYIFSKENINLGMIVKDNNIGCIVNGNNLITAANNASGFNQGGIGFKTWDPLLNNTEIEVRKINVSLIKDPIETELANLDKTILVEKPVDPTKPVTGKPTPKPTPKPVEEHFAVLSLPYFKTNPDFLMKDWKNLWGSIIINSEGFRLFSNMNTAGSFAVMPGSKEWTNYFYTAKIDLVKGLSFGLIARETDPNNYLSCTFINYKNGTYYAKLERVIDSKSETLAKVKLPRYFPLEWKNVAFGIKVDGNDAQCLANGDTAFTVNIPTLQSKGSVGLKTWDEMNGNSEINIRTIDIQNIN